jgi:hypothetical protein
MILLCVAAMPHATPHVIVDQVTKPLGIADSGWAIFAACAAAAAAAAIATAILAFITRHLAPATRDMASSTKDLANETADLGKQTATSAEESIANENANYRATTTIGILNRYNEVAIPVTETIALTRYTAAAQIGMFADDFPELRRLRDQYDPHSKGDQHEQFRVIAASNPILVNFYMTALQMLRRDLLDVRLFMNTFAKTFLAVIGAIRTVNAEIHAAPEANVDRLNDFERMCQQWGLRDPENQSSVADNGN